jgi:hypothetical protein
VPEPGKFGRYSGEFEKLRMLDVAQNSSSAHLDLFDNRSGYCKRRASTKMKCCFVRVAASPSQKQDSDNKFWHAEHDYDPQNERGFHYHNRCQDSFRFAFSSTSFHSKDPFLLSISFQRVTSLLIDALFDIPINSFSSEFANYQNFYFHVEPQR